jgi:hypothetical protein
VLHLIKTGGAKVEQGGAARIPRDTCSTTLPFRGGGWGWSAGSGGAGRVEQKVEQMRAIQSDRGTIQDIASDTITRTWDRSHGTYIAGRAYADEADHTAAQMEAKWGADRLRLLVGPDLREKFDRQRYLFNQAIWHGDLEAVRQQSMRMVKAWLALDKAASEAGATKLDPQVWEISLEDGSVAAIVPSNEQARLVEPDGRRVSVYTLEEIGRLLAGYPGLAKVKAAFPGATVTQVRRNVSDPLDSIATSDKPLDAELAEDEIPF